MLSIMSGVRQGELLGLKWSDVDWSNNQICVQRTFNNQKWYKPKSKASARKINLGPSMMRELKRWRLACPPSDLDLVFPNGAGGPINHNNMVNRHFEPALKKAGIERIRFHDFEAYFCEPFNRPRGKHHIHPNPTGAFESQRHPERICSPHKAPRSERCESIGNDHF